MQAHLIAGYSALVLLSLGGSLAQAAPGQAADEVIVTAKYLRELERQVRDAEDEMYELFNEYNTDAMFDIHCRMRAQVGSRLRQRQCVPRFSDLANEEWAETGLAQITEVYSGGSRRAVNTKLELYNAAMEEKWQLAAAQHPGFAEAVRRHSALRAQLEESTERLNPARD